MAEYNLGTARGRIELDASGVRKGTDKASQHMQDFERDAKSRMDNVSKKFKDIGGKMQSAGKGMSQALTLPLLAIGGASVKAASDAEEMRSKFNVVFGDLAGDAEEWASSHADAVNRSSNDLMGYMASLQDTFVPMGFAREEAMGMSKQVTELGVDLASFNNMAEDEAINKLRSGLVGSHEALLDFGVVIKQASLDQELLNMGIEGGAAAASEQEKMQARLNMIMKGTSDAQGDAARTSGSFANQMKGLKADLEDVAIAIGEQLIPMFSGIIESVKGAFDWFSNLSDSQQRIITIVGIVVAALGPLLVILGMMANAIGALIPVVAAISAPMLAWVAGIGALVAALVWAYNNVEWFRDGVRAAWDVLKSVFKIAWDVIKAIFSAFVETIKGVLSTVKTVWDAISSAISYAWNRVIQPLLQAAIRFFNTTLKPAFIAVKDAVQTVFDTIGNIISYVWSKVVYPLLVGAGRFLRNTFVPAFNFVKDSITTVFDTVGSVIKGAWDRVIKPVFDTIKRFIERTFVPVWETMRDTIEDIWNGIKDAASSVWNGITRTIGGVVNGIIGIVNSFINGVNRVANAIGLGDLINSIATVAVEAATYHKGGIVGEHGGPKKSLADVRGDEEVAILKKGELVLTPEDAAMMAERGGPFDFAKDMVGKAWDSVSSAAGNLADKVRGVVANVAKPMISGALSGLDGLVGGIQPFGDIFGSTVRTLSEKVLDWIGGAEEEVANRDSSIPAADGMPYNRLVKFLGSKLSSSAFRVTSTLRNGSGGSLHNVGRAADFAGPTPGTMTSAMRKIWSVFAGASDQLRELIYTGAPWGILGGQRVPTSSMSSFLRSTHRDHVHAALAAGGIIDRPTMALLGEYAGARRNPEIASPVSLMREVFREEMNRNGGMTFNGDIVLPNINDRSTADDLLAGLRQAARRR